MWNDPDELLALARRRQRELTRDLDALRGTAEPAPAWGDVARSWLTAARTTTSFVRAFVTR